MLTFSSSCDSRQNLFHDALAGLQANCRLVKGSNSPVLIEGGYYSGIWMECAPLEGLVYAPVSTAVARLNHTSFFREQFADGQIPPYIWAEKVGSGQIQQTVPIAETAYELAMMTGDEELLRETYHAWEKWDAWMTGYRDTQHQNICEAFCEYDTGHDNSGRFHGISKRCPMDDAKICPAEPGMPRIAPDLTATLYGGRMTLAKIASALEMSSEHDHWRGLAEKTKQALVTYCYDPETEFFYDRDRDGNLVKILGDAGLRVLMEHVPDQAMFDRIFSRWIINPQAFWTTLPLPSVAASDPAFIHPPRENCWGGPCQALLALRAPRWMEYYGKYSALDHLMHRYLEAFEQAGVFCQQFDPLTGETTPGTGEYSPAMCCVVDFISRLAGILQTPDGMSWGCGALRPGETASFKVDLYRNRGTAEITHLGSSSRLSMNEKELARVNGNVRIFTDTEGIVLRMAAISAGEITLALPGKPLQAFDMAADESIVLNP